MSKKVLFLNKTCNFEKIIHEQNIRVHRAEKSMKYPLSKFLLKIYHVPQYFSLFRLTINSLKQSKVVVY